MFSYARFLWLLPAFFLLGIQPAPSPQSLRQGKDFALFFAVDTYPPNIPGLGNLKNPIRDADAIAKELQAYYGFQTLVYRNPTKSEITQVINAWKGKNFGPQDQLFVFFTGHGTVSEFDNEGYFIPADGRHEDKYLSLLSLRKAITQIDCPHILLAVDACYSGTILSKSTTRPSPTRLGETESSQVEREIQRELANASRYILTSGGRERTQDGVNHSPFTEGILAVLQNAYRQNRAIVYWEDLVSGMKQVQPDKPRNGTFGGHENGGFVFVRQGSAPPPKPASNIQQDYLTAVTCGTAACYETFLRRYHDPNDPLVKAAQTQLDALRPTINSNPTKPVNTRPNPTDLTPGPKMVFIEGGTFEMGSEDGDSDEKPVHQVSISDFYLAETEVTNAQFCEFLNEQEAKGAVENGWYNPSGSGHQGHAAAAIQKKLNGSWKVESSRENHPVNHVSWYGAVAYCQWLSQKTRLKYRLPTEAEWEYAAGGGSSGRTKWSGTSRESDLRAYGNFEGTGGQDTYSGLAPVGSFGQNSLQLYDMSGNVWEWCSDWYGKDYYAGSPTRDPPGPASGSLRVDRGGCWSYGASNLRVANRNSVTPDYRDYDLGFRPARAL